MSQGYTVVNAGLGQIGHLVKKVHFRGVRVAPQCASVILCNFVIIFYYLDDIYFPQSGMKMQSENFDIIKAFLPLESLCHVDHRIIF